MIVQIDILAGELSLQFSNWSCSEMRDYLIVGLWDRSSTHGFDAQLPSITLVFRSGEAFWKVQPIYEVIFLSVWTCPEKPGILFPGENTAARGLAPWTARGFSIFSGSQVIKLVRVQYFQVSDDQYVSFSNRSRSPEIQSEQISIIINSPGPQIKWLTKLSQQNTRTAWSEM